MNSCLEANSKISTSSAYNPYLHGTNSSILALLPKTEFTLLSPIEMIKRYQIAPLTGEITGGGLSDFCSESKTAFGRLQSDGVNHYTLEIIMQNYASQKAIILADRTKLIADVKLHFKNLFQTSFNNINILLIYFARAKQAGITNIEVISEEDTTDIFAHIDATIQFHYLILLFGKMLNPIDNWVENLNSEQIKDILYAISTHLSFRSIVNKLLLSPLDVKSIYENSEPSQLEISAVEDLIELPKESTISICNDPCNIFYANKPVVLEKTKIFSAVSATNAAYIINEEYEDLSRFPNPFDVITHILNHDYHEKINNFLRFFAVKKLSQSFFTNLERKIFNQIENLQHRFDLLKKLFEQEPSNALDMRYETFITHAFPLILICENDENMTLINKSTMEYRSEIPMRLDENITMIATSLENQEIILNYLAENDLTSISVITFEQLKESRILGIKPMGIRPLLKLADESTLPDDAECKAELCSSAYDDSRTTSRTPSEFSFSRPNLLCIFSARQEAKNSEEIELDSGSEMKA